MSSGSEGSPCSPGSPTNDSDEESNNESQIYELIMQVVIPYFFPIRVPRNTSTLRGNDWVGEILHGHEGRFYDNFRMNKPTFMSLLHTLTSRGYLTQSKCARVSVMEELALFMRTVGMHHRQRDSMERFQHSLETINRHIRRVIKALNLLAAEVITPPNFDDIHPKLAEEPDFAFFQNAVGAIDGTLVPAWVPASKRNAYRSRKSHVSQNVLAICDFDLMFTYVYAGWEGSANDALVLRNAIANDPSFPFPPHGKYYLVDAGYTNYMCFLAPYRGCRRHIEEFNRGTQAMTGPHEAFNYTHARLRNCIERCFGILKKRFPILAWGMPSYRIHRQVQMVIACCVLHNYIRKFSRDDEIFNKELDKGDVDNDTFYHKGHPSQAMVQAQAQFRDGIAHALWEQYSTS